ncbi:MAG: YciI-like protein [Gammaproteobacteria bacterium]
MYYLLFYDYVDHIAERRTPFRDRHLALARDAQRRGELVLGGAVGEGLDGAVLAFRTDDVTAVEAFVAADPYVDNGLVTRWRIEPWHVVVGSYHTPQAD